MALEMESDIQRRGELHVTAASMPASAAFPLRSQLTLQQGKVSKTFPSTKRNKALGQAPMELIGCPSFRLFKNNKIGVN